MVQHEREKRKHLCWIEQSQERIEKAENKMIAYHEKLSRNINQVNSLMASRLRDQRTSLTHSIGHDTLTSIDSGLERPSGAKKNLQARGKKQGSLQNLEKTLL